MNARCLVVLTVLTALPAAARAETEDPALRHARALLAKTLLIDGHNDLPWAIRTAKDAPHDVVAYDLRKTTLGNTDLKRLREGGLGGQFWSVYIPGEDKTAGYARVQLEQIDIARRVIARYPEALTLALTADEVERAFKQRRIGSLLGMEGGHAIENSLGALRAYFDLGVRYMTLTHNTTLDWADSANDKPAHGGLTRFGEEVVREMNRLGMLVDLSHTAPDTMEDAIRVSEAPIIFSHSSARAICDVPRNVPDAVLKLIPKNGGVVMVTFVPGFLSQQVATAATPVYMRFFQQMAATSDPAEKQRLGDELKAAVTALGLPRVTIGQVADHVDHIRKVAGVDHVGLGGDYDGNDSWPEGLEDVTGYPRLFAELIRRGWTDADLKKLAGGNILRVMRNAEAVARRLQAARPPSTATIEVMDLAR